MKVVVGSTAARYWGFGREPKDLDIWTDSDADIKGDVKIIPTTILNLINTKNGYACLDDLYTIKCSHSGWSNPMWSKNKQDVLLLKSKGCKLNKELYNSLVLFWKEELGDKSFLSLDRDKEDFFTDHVKYIYNHDYLHEVVSGDNPPVYTRVLKEGNDVLIDKEKFDNLSFEEQVDMFKEEITVIALERWVLNPHWKGKVSWFKAHSLSLQKTITTLTKNWATDFIVLNLEHFIKPDYTLYSKALNLEGK